MPDKPTPPPPSNSKFSLKTDRALFCHEVLKHLDPWFTDKGYPFPLDRIQVGHGMGLRGPNRFLGDAYRADFSGDQTFHLTVGLTLSDARLVIAQVSLEACKIAAFCAPNTKTSRVRWDIGWRGKKGNLTTTPELKKLIDRIEEIVGKYPQASFGIPGVTDAEQLDAKPPQVGRNLKCVCTHPGCAMRLNVARETFETVACRQHGWEWLLLTRKKEVVHAGPKTVQTAELPPGNDDSSPVRDAAE